MMDVDSNIEPLRRTLVITHKSGMHARASTKFVEVANSFQSLVELARGEDDGNGSWVNGKSVIQILTLGVELGDKITLKVKGRDAEAALEALTALVEDDFHGV